MQHRSGDEDGSDRFVAPTRRSLHGVAELLLAGPQFAVSGTIRLRRTEGGFGTVAEPSGRVDGTRVVGGRGAVDLDGRTPAEVGRELGIEPRPLGDVYAAGAGVGLDEVLQVDAGAAAVLAEAFAAGDEALRAVAAGDVPVLWPEHFDLSVVEDEVTYGVSPGDAHVPAPYAYVAPWDVAGLTDDFWNVPFGAARRLTDLPDPTDLVAFFEEGRRLSRGTRS